MSLTTEMNDLLQESWGEGAMEQEFAWAREAMLAVMAAAADPDNHISIAAFLAALQVRGAKGSHLAGFSSALRSLGRSIDFGEDRLVDTCGTGGGIPSLNLSTGAALLAAAAGAKVAKHGNRGVTSACGSADILEALGITITPDEGKLKEGMVKANFAFLFAPHFYEPIGWVRPVRTKIGMRTVFNQLGPLLNPAGAKRQIVGVYHPSLLKPTADALAALGSESSWVVHGSDGMDEISPTSSTRRIVVHQGEARPEDLWSASDQLGPIPPEGAAPSPSAQEGAARIMKGLTDPHSAEFFALLPTTAAALHISLDLSLPEAASLARETAASGRASETVAILAEVTKG